MKTGEKKNKKRSLLISIGVHSALFMLAMIPVAVHLDKDLADEVLMIIPLEFAEFARSNNASLQAKSPVPDVVEKPVTDQQEQPDIVEAEMILDVTQATEESELLESEVVEEVSEILASEDRDSGDAEVASSEGGSNATRETGITEGTDKSGDEDGHQGLDGTGVITRKIIYRADISKAAYHSGVIAVNLCIDRRGVVLAVAKNDERTTITDSDMIRHALFLAAEYRFEVDFTAAARECGVLTFIFDKYDDTYHDYVIAR